MGYNTTVVVLNDALDSIEHDPLFGEMLAKEIRHASFQPDEPLDVPARGFGSAARIIETHHSSDEVAVIVGRNTGRVQTPDIVEEARKAAYEAGYEAGRKKKQKTLEARVAELEASISSALKSWTCKGTYCLFCRAVLKSEHPKVKVEAHGEECATHALERAVRAAGSVSEVKRPDDCNCDGFEPYTHNSWCEYITKKAKTNASNQDDGHGPSGEVRHDPHAQGVPERLVGGRAAEDPQGGSSGRAGEAEEVTAPGSSNPNPVDPSWPQHVQDMWGKRCDACSYANGHHWVKCPNLPPDHESEYVSHYPYEPISQRSSDALAGLDVVLERQRDPSRTGCRCVCATCLRYATLHSPCEYGCDLRVRETVPNCPKHVNRSNHLGGTDQQCIREVGHPGRCASANDVATGAWRPPCGATAEDWENKPMACCLAASHVGEHRTKCGQSWSNWADEPRSNEASPVVDEKPVPIPMVLHCPECKTRHIDEGDFATKPHHTHSCQGCGLTWRPAVVATVGVQFLPGFKNEPRTQEATPPEPDTLEAKSEAALKKEIRELSREQINRLLFQKIKRDDEKDARLYLGGQRGVLREIAGALDMSISPDPATSPTVAEVIAWAKRPVTCGHERLMKQAKDVVRAWEDDPTSTGTENEIRELGLRADSAVDAAQRTDKVPGKWRVGRKLGRTLYIGDRCVGIVDNALIAEELVAAANAPALDYPTPDPIRNSVAEVIVYLQDEIAANLRGVSRDADFSRGVTAAYRDVIGKLEPLLAVRRTDLPPRLQEAASLVDDLETAPTKLEGA